MLLQSDNDDSQMAGILSMLTAMKMQDVTEKIFSSDKFVGIDCSQEVVGKQCKAQPVCCENNYFVGVCLTASLSF